MRCYGLISLIINICRWIFQTVFVSDIRTS